MKKINIILIIILGLTFNCKAQSQLQSLNNYTNDIVGSWVSEEDTDYKIEFTTNNTYNIYVNGILEGTFYYNLGTTCESNTSNGYDIFLKIKENISSIDYTCNIINNISTDSNGIIILSITTERGELDKYKKE